MKGTGRLDFTTSFRAISSAVRVLGLHPSGRGFKSLIAHCTLQLGYIMEIRYLLQKIHRYCYGHNVLTMPALRRGQWYDTDTKMFEALFTLLCEYVENECAHMELMDTKKYSRWTRLRHRWLPRKFRKALSRELGLANLDWAINEPDCQQHQRDTAEMTKDLYVWYTTEYPLMRDPYEMANDPEFIFVDASGNPTNEMVTAGGNMNKFHPQYHAMLNTIHDIENTQNNLIDTKLEDILAIRRSLWT